MLSSIDPMETLWKKCFTKVFDADSLSDLLYRCGIFLQKIIPHLYSPAFVPFFFERIYLLCQFGYGVVLSLTSIRLLARALQHKG
mmetsp:Transcript_11696/g.29626  ORF Transcript_11696/g.29626 Transcript_11696/m.29626 type:complete len:85 (+) Transcript_11696:2298-2552(+)